MTNLTSTHHQNLFRTYLRWHKNASCTGPFPKNYESVERTLRDLRRKKYSKSPKTVEEIENGFKIENIAES